MKQNKSFLLMWSGQLLSNIGSGLSIFVLGIYLYQLTGSATYYAMLMLAAFLPSLILRPLGGILADRFDRRLLMIIGDLGAAVGVAFTCFMLWIGVTSLWPIYVGASLSSVFVAFHNPAYKASVTDLVDEAFYSKASGLMQLAEASKILISPLIASFLFLIMNIQQILILDIATFLLGILPLFWMVKQNKNNVEVKTHFIQDFMLGWQYLMHHRSVLCLLLTTSLLTFFVGVLQALWGPMILTVSDERTLGIVQTIATSGMVLGGGFMGFFGQTQPIKVLSIGLSMTGLFFALMGGTSTILFTTLFGFLFFLTLPLVNTSLDVLIRSHVDNQMQGRVWSLVSLISQSGMLIALSIAGWIADHLFNPLLMQDGFLSANIGEIIGVGPGRGMGFMFVLSGICMIIVGFIIPRVAALRMLSDMTPDTAEVACGKA